MSDTTTPAAPTPAPAPEPAATTSAGTQAPEGFVSREELDRVEAQRRSFQAEADRLRAELARATPVAPAAPAAEPAAPAAASTGFDPEAFRRSLLTEVATATRVATAAEKFKAEYPHAAVADPTIFDRAAEYGSVDAFEASVKSAHDRVAALLAAQAPAGDGSGTAAAAAAAAAVVPPGGAPATAAGDPTPEQLVALPMSKWDELEKASPGVIDRVLRSVE